MSKPTYTCLLCGRSSFSYPGQPHKCVGGFRKRFKKEAARRGLSNAFKKNPPSYGEKFLEKYKEPFHWSLEP